MKLLCHTIATVRQNRNWLPLYPIGSWKSLPDDSGHTRCWCCAATIRPGDECVGQYFVYTSVTFCITCARDNPEVMAEWMMGGAAVEPEQVAP
jgi:hypothetical protein